MITIANQFKPKFITLISCLFHSQSIRLNALSVRWCCYRCSLCLSDANVMVVCICWSFDSSWQLWRINIHINCCYCCCCWLNVWWWLGIYISMLAGGFTNRIVSSKMSAFNWSRGKSSNSMSSRNGLSATGYENTKFRWLDLANWNRYRHTKMHCGNEWYRTSSPGS